MILLGNLISGVAMVLSTLLTMYFWIIIIATLLTWVRPDPYNPIVRTLTALTEPLFYRVRKWLPFTLIGGVDLSPVVVLIAIQLLQVVIVNSLVQWAAVIRTTGIM